MTITSKFHPFNSIIAPILMVVVLGALGFLLVFLSFLDVNIGKVDSIFKTPIYGSFLLFAAAIGLVYHYLKTCKKIQINNNGIKLSSLFNSESIPWNEIIKIELIGKSRNRMIIAETTNLDLKSGKEIDIIASYYQNMPSLRITLEQVHQFLTNNEPVELKQAPIPHKPESVWHLNLNAMKKYSNNHFLSFNGIMIYGWIAFSIYFLLTLGLTRNLGSLLLVTSVMSGIFYGFLGYQLHYFYLDKNYLVVKNHVWPWVNHIYKIEDINEVALEIPYKRSISLRVITKEYQSKLYQGGSLRKNTWEKLMKDFNDLKVNVTNAVLI